MRLPRRGVGPGDASRSHRRSRARRYGRTYGFPFVQVFADRNRVEKEETFELPAAARDRPGLDFTNMARGLGMALSMFATDRPDEHHVILLVSDGGAVLESHVQDQLRAEFKKFPTDLYFLYLRLRSRPRAAPRDQARQGRRRAALPRRAVDRAQTVRKVGRHAPMVGLVALASLSLAACNDTSEAPDHVVTIARPHDIPAWLTSHDTIEPAIWLRSREVGHEVLPTDPEVDRLRRGLHQATPRFYEDSRMIANRTEQTGEILAEAQMPERYVDILTGMIDVADVSAQKKLYGEMVQHYINLRKQGKDRSSALKQLMAAYSGRDDNHQD